MTRSMFAAAAMVALAGTAVSPLFATGCTTSGVGDPCTPEQEYDPTFNGFVLDQVNTEAKSFQCQTRLCLVNHFQGRASCPYGQDAAGQPLSKQAGACTVPGSQDPITGDPNDPTKKAAVAPQCSTRTADKSVYCSCRCANVDGKTDDGANYCKCPDGYGCQQLVDSIGPIDTGLTGAYCVKDKTTYDRSNPPACGTDKQCNDQNKCN